MYSFIKFVSIIYLVNTVAAKSTLNYPIATTEKPVSIDVSPDYDINESRQGRGMTMEDYDHIDVHDHHHEEEMQEEKAVKTDPWASYYDFIINEGSFKFWAAFQLGTALLLIYSAFAAIYYAKFNVLTTDYDYYDGFFGKSDSGRSTSSNSDWLGLGAETVQRILTAISSKKFS